MNSSQTIDVDIATIVPSNMSELLLETIGNPWSLDIIYLVLTPLNAVSFVFSTFTCLRLATNKPKRIEPQIYRFLCTYTINNSILGFILLFTFLNASHFIPFFFFSMSVRIYRCLIVNYILGTIFYVNKVLEICILNDRLLQFKPNQKEFFLNRLLNMRITIPVIYIFSALLNILFYLRRQIKSDEKLISDLTAFTITKYIQFCDPMPFTITITGLVITACAVFIRDILTLGIEIMLSFQLILSFRHFLSFKLKPQANLSNLMRRLHNNTAACGVQNAIRFASFRKTMRTVMIFAIISIILNMISTLLNLLVMSISKNIGIVAMSVIAVYIVLQSLKPFITFYVFYRLDKNFAESVCTCYPIKK
jgi:hypothetical protein